MSIKINRIVKGMKEAIKSDKRTTTPYDTVAKVVKVEDGIAWVHIDGGVDQTPVKISANVKVGDEVQVRISGGQAWAYGNYTAPPTDDTVARRAVEDITLTGKAVKKIKVLVDSVSKIAGDTAQYFWHTQEGTDTGVHITEIPKEDFLADPDSGGGNLLARSNGIAVRDGLTELAQFGADGARIGQENESHLEQDYHSMQLVDYLGQPYFHVSDLRTRHSSSEEFGEGYYYIMTDKFIATGSPYSSYELSHYSDITTYPITVNGSRVSSGSIRNRDHRAFMFEPSEEPSSGDTIVVTYPCSQEYIKAYTSGIRKDGSDIGLMSFAEGYKVDASGNYSHAEGRNTTASGVNSHAEGNMTKAEGTFSHAENHSTKATGYCSHAQGSGTVASGQDSHAGGLGTIASRLCQTVIGMYNAVSRTGSGTDADPYVDDAGNYAFVVGNGTGDEPNNRSNAFTVDWEGNADFAGNIYARNIESATIVSGIGTVNAGAIVDVPVTFTKTFSSAPVVNATFITSAVPYTADFGNLQLGIYSVSATGCVIRIYNGGGTAVTPGINYIAIGS